MPNDLYFDVTAALERWPERNALSVFQGKWSDKHWMNTPGPIYCGECDNSGTGPPQAPNNVEVDSRGFQVIWRQPVIPFELRQVLYAAGVDPFQAYAMDGDAHWSYRAVQAWWSEKRPEIEREVEHMRQVRLMHGVEAWAGVARWLDYFRYGLRDYLRGYAFFLDEGRVPREGDRLPEM